MKNVIRLALTGLMLATVPALSVGCATSSAGAKSASEPIELDGTKWKLAVAGGRMDGRIIQFKKEGAGYVGYLIDPGKVLRDVTGIDGGNTWVFKVSQKSPTEYDGAYRVISRDGTFAEREVLLSVSGDDFSWNLESATWERVKD